MVLDALRIVWHDRFAQRNGRRGQRQDGVDIIGTYQGQCVVAQAKNSKTISRTTLLQEIAKAEQFSPGLSRYFITISGARDARLQEKVRGISLERTNKGQFGVDILFFEDICHELATRPDLLRKYWGAFFTEAELLAKALPAVLTTGIQTPEEAMDRVFAAKEYRDFADMLHDRSAGAVQAHLHISGAPDLNAPPGSSERAWWVAVGENHEDHVAILFHIGVIYDSGELVLDEAARVFGDDGDADNRTGTTFRLSEELSRIELETGPDSLQCASNSQDDTKSSGKAVHLAEVQDTPTGITFTLSSSTLFDSGQTGLTVTGQLALGRMSGLLSRLSPLSHLTVVGHTDSIGLAATNDEMSRARANSVREYLATLGIAAEHITAIGKGREQPIDDNKTPEGRARNRRIEIVVDTNEPVQFANASEEVQGHRTSRSSIPPEQ